MSKVNVFFLAWFLGAPVWFVVAALWCRFRRLTLSNNTTVLLWLWIAVWPFALPLLLVNQVYDVVAKWVIKSWNFLATPKSQ